MLNCDCNLREKSLELFGIFLNISWILYFRGYIMFNINIYLLYLQKGKNGAGICKVKIR